MELLVKEEEILGQVVGFRAFLHLACRCVFARKWNDCQTNKQKMEQSHQVKI